MSSKATVASLRLAINKYIVMLYREDQELVGDRRSLGKLIKMSRHDLRKMFRGEVVTVNIDTLIARAERLEKKVGHENMLLFRMADAITKKELAS